ncbi:clathrin heavy chain [Theileria orientalis strain Shintoku]|uniref:Clathrin heavy chain n=1 Tax=Theileria orientalis strain Shintoku TaxID=869250 RepID=J4C8N7_THEOR|nr:clathrin heavy chain [Theileria orientalis strain Shintoku]BAM41108.1 clathrin heavy chain [Theileria orientalis strain Shintoku]|eukprot:XP_009691409.1 clathrin heavy chain [Theileria orientalis strain Shintoku]
MSTNPVLLSTVLDLKKLGFAESSFKFDVLSLEGDRYVSIKDQDGENLTVAIIDMYNGNAITRKPMKAEAAIMNPSDPVIALRAKLDSNCFVQVFNLETKEKMGYHQFDQKVSYWKWLTNKELVVVTDNYVYHWEVGRSDPRLVFERCGKLLDSGTKLVGYSADALNKWCLIFGIYSNDQGATIDGAIQLYSTEKRQQQLFEGYAGTFGQLRTSNETMEKTNLLVFCEHKKNSNNIKLHLMDIYGTNSSGSEGQEAAAKALKVSCALEKNNDYPNDFPIAIHVLDSNGLILVLTKSGFAHFYYSTTLTYLFTERVSVSPLFVSCNKKVDGKTAGVLAVNRNGEVLKVMVDEDRLLGVLDHLEDVCVGIATCYGLRGSDRLLLQSFETFFTKGQYKQAAQIVATLKSNELRTLETIHRFKNQSTPTGNALSYYFSVMLEAGKLNEVESLELVKPVLQQNRKELVKKWMDQDKLTESEQLGDLLSQMDYGLAFKVYTKIKAHMKAIMCLIDSKQTTKILTYISKMLASAGDQSGVESGVTHVVNSVGDKVALVQGLPSVSMLVENVANKHPEALVPFVNDLLKGLKKGEPLCDVVEVTELLIRLNKLKELNEVLLDYLKSNAKQHSKLQTRLLEVNLKNDPRVAETILQLDILTEFDKEYIARLCEEVGLYEYALQFYSNLGDLKRLIVKSVGTLSEKTLNNALNAMTNDNALEVFKEMLEASVNMEVLVSSAVSLHSKLGALKLYSLFESNNSKGAVLFNYLKRLPFIQNSNAAAPSQQQQNVNTAADINELILKYLGLCILNDEVIELERVVRENSHFDLFSAKEMLKSSALGDPKPLMIVCNRMGCVRELVEYLYNSDMARHVEVFVSSINPASVSEVVATLLDLGSNDQLLNKILSNLRDTAGMKAIIKVAEERHQLMMLQSFLETRIKEGYKEEELHTCLMKIYITSAQNAEEHLKTNKFYNRVQVAKYCEDIDVQLSYLIYNENGMNKQLIELCLKHQLYKQLNQYMLKVSKLELYKLLYDELMEKGQPEKSKAGTTAAVSPAGSVAGTTGLVTAAGVVDGVPTQAGGLDPGAVAAGDMAAPAAVTVTGSGPMAAGTPGFDSDRSAHGLQNDTVKLGQEKAESSQFTTVFDELLVMCIDNCNSNEISVLIKFFLSQEMNKYLITLLEGLLLNQTEFSKNSNLQNLLLATTIKTNPAKLQEYLNKLNNYEVNSLAKLANELGLYHSSYQLYRKVDKYQEAFNELVFLEQMYNKPSTPQSSLEERNRDLKRLNNFENREGVLKEMLAYATLVDKSAIWFKLGKIYLDRNMLNDGVDCYLKSGNFTHNAQIKQACKEQPELLLRWLREATKIKQVPELVNDLLIMLAKMSETSEFLAVLNANAASTDLNTVGNELMNLGLYKESVDVFTRTNNYNKLAICYVQLSRYDEACDSALRSRNPKVLKDTFDTVLSSSPNYHSIQKTKLLGVLAGELLNYPEFLTSIVLSYEALGYFDELIDLLRRANKTVATSTELAIALAKFHPELLMEHLRNVAFESNSINISKTARECSNLWLWREAVFLYTIDDSDKAVLSMILHPDCFEQDLFFRTLKNVSNNEVIYKALYFCIQQHPMLVPKLLLNMRNKFDNTRLIKILKNNNCIQLAREFLELYADRNSALINDTLYELLVEEHNSGLLEEHIGKFLSYDHAKLCALLEDHPLASMRNIAAKIYCKDHNYAKAALIYLKNANFIRAVDSARHSKSPQLVHEVISTLLARDELNHFVVCLVVNFTLVDVAEVLELVWLNNVSLDLVMPFLIHLQRFLAFKKPAAAAQYHLTHR